MMRSCPNASTTGPTNTSITSVKGDGRYHFQLTIHHDPAFPFISLFLVISLTRCGGTWQWRGGRKGIPSRGNIFDAQVWKERQSGGVRLICLIMRMIHQSHNRQGQVM